MIRAISNVTFIALALALWVCSMESARGAIYVDGSSLGNDKIGDTSTDNPGIYPSMPLKTIAAAMNRLGTSSQTTVYVRGYANGNT